MFKLIAGVLMTLGGGMIFLAGCAVDSCEPTWLILCCILIGFLLLVAGDLLRQYIKEVERIRRVKRRRNERKKSA